MAGIHAVGIRIAQGVGFARSFLIYAVPWRQRALRRLYAPFMRHGDTVFDIGAHLGDRSAAFAGLGARVIAVEPQAFPQRYLRWRLGRSSEHVVLGEALAAQPGTAVLAMSDRHPTLATLSNQWRSQMGQDNPGFSHVAWQREIEVAVTTLDALIERYGQPAFCKIDVEGFEAEVLEGLSQPLPALSFEYLYGGEVQYRRCIERLEQLGMQTFNLTIGEQRQFVFEDWQKAHAILAWLEINAEDAGSGDVYARW
jgi:FkbM family methyltransferase